MTWKAIRLELAPIDGFPEGSASRALLLRAPLDELGQIDVQAIARNPGQATVRRFWPSERDESGQLERVDGSWVFRPRGMKGNQEYRLAAGPFQADAQIIVSQPDGTELPFRVVSIEGLGVSAAVKS